MVFDEVLNFRRGVGEGQIVDLWFTGASRCGQPAAI